MRLDWRLALRIALAAVMVALLALAVRRLDAPAILQAIRRSNGFWLLAATVCYAMVLPLWALQWRLLSPPSARNSFSRMFGVVGLTSTTLNTTPFFAGEIAGVALLRSRIGLTNVQALSVLALDQAGVGIAKLALLGMAAILVVVPDWMRSPMKSAAIGTVAIVVAIALVVRFAIPLAALLRRLLPPTMCEAISRGMSEIARLALSRVGGAVIAIALLKKSCEVAALLAGLHAFGVDLPPAAAVVALAAVNMATLIPLVPGNLGAFEGALSLAYTSFGVERELAVGLSVVQHACYLAAFVLPGYAWLLRPADDRVVPANS